jgi:broad specificity phosphatase PhoE
MKVYLIRHGESMGNAIGIHQGQKNDFPLSERGKKQSDFLGKRFRDVEISAVYSSDLARAKETADFISNAKGLTTITDARLRERDFGIIGEENDIMRAWKNFLSQAAKNGADPWGVSPPNGESDKDHFDRVKSFFEDLRKRHGEDDSAVVVAHGGTNKVALGVIGHFSLAEMHKAAQGNTCVNELEFGNDGWNLNLLNCMKHLEVEREVIDAFEAIRDRPLDVINYRSWEKHVQLKEFFESKGYKAKYKACSFKWSVQNLPENLLKTIHEDLDHHLYLVVKMDGLKLIVDASNDSSLPSYNVWDGRSDCALCVKPEGFVDNVEEIMARKLNEKCPDNQLLFLKGVNSFFEELRKKP